MAILLLIAFLSSFVLMWAIVTLSKRKQWFVNEADMEGVHGGGTVNFLLALSVYIISGVQ